MYELDTSVLVISTLVSLALAVDFGRKLFGLWMAKKVVREQHRPLTNIEIKSFVYSAARRGHEEAALRGIEEIRRAHGRSGITLGRVFELDMKIDGTGKKPHQK